MKNEEMVADKVVLKKDLLKNEAPFPANCGKGRLIPVNRTGSTILFHTKTTEAPFLAAGQQQQPF